MNEDLMDAIKEADEDLLAEIEAAEAIEDTEAMLTRLRMLLVGRCFKYVDAGQHSSGAILRKIESIGLYCDLAHGQEAADIEVKTAQVDVSLWRDHRTLAVNKYDDTLDYFKYVIQDSVEVSIVSFDCAVALANQCIDTVEAALGAIEALQ